MTEKRIIILAHPMARANAVQAVRTAPDGYKVVVSEPSRTLDQNAAQWPILEAFSHQLDWPVNGERVKLPPEDWKDILTAAFQKELVRIAQGLDGGMVMLGMRTSKMGKKTFSEYLEFLNATAAMRGVVL
jgi:NinB protein